MAETDSARPVHGRRVRSRSRFVLIGFAIAIGASIAIGFSTDILSSPPIAAQPIPKLVVDTEFVPTEQQLQSLVIKPVEAMTFRSETVTDGYIAADDDLTTPVFSPFSGRVAKLFVKLGDHVEKDAALATVEAAEFVQTQSDLLAAKTQYILAKTNEMRQHELYEAEGAALKDWQQSQADLTTADATLTAVRNRLRIFGKTEKEIADLEQAPQIAGMRAETIVAAPIAGTIVQRQIGLGQYIQAGSSTPVYSIGDLSKVWLIANVREIDGAHVRIGDPVEVRVLAIPGKVFKSKISYVAPSIDPTTHRLAFRAELDNRDGALKPQMFANFTILNGDDVTASSVPQSAIVYEGESARVWVLTPKGTLVPHQIRTGRVNGDLVEVTKGLMPGEKLVVSGALFIDRAATGQ
jgi:cobalt-zinc-cadmium efflux system membrane fusion protein